SRSGSMLQGRGPTVRGGWSGSCSERLRRVNRRHASEQLVKTKSATQTLPSRSSRANGRPRSSVSEKGGSRPRSGSAAGFCLSRSGATGIAKASAANRSHPGESLSRPGVAGKVVSATLSSGQRGKPRPAPFVKPRPTVLYVREEAQSVSRGERGDEKKARNACSADSRLAFGVAGGLAGAVADRI